ncbi:MAG: hypothetical protein EOM40_10505 [Clostridia bacterium]|nr:hypothetical protein [Clostridia bacterium]NCC42543.1 hypothetical protein [Clostridia bacterium]
MTYLVMECHLGYAVVLDSEGRFIKAANLGYEVGQTITQVIPYREAKEKSKISVLGSWVAAAASICIMMAGIWQFLLTPYGSVKMHINPDVQIEVNSLDYVIGLEGLNEDGEELIEGYTYQFKHVEQVSDELADKAVELGFLKEGGTIHFAVESEHTGWKSRTEEKLSVELEIHFRDSVMIILDSTEGDDVIIIPVTPKEK